MSLSDLCYESVYFLEGGKLVYRRGKETGAITGKTGGLCAGGIAVNWRLERKNVGKGWLGYLGKMNPGRQMDQCHVKH